MYAKRSADYNFIDVKRYSQIKIKKKEEKYKINKTL
jgi:hypothetical protein